MTKEEEKNLSPVELIEKFNQELREIDEETIPGVMRTNELGESEPYVWMEEKGGYIPEIEARVIWKERRIKKENEILKQLRKQVNERLEQIEFIKKERVRVKRSKGLEKARLQRQKEIASEKAQKENIKIEKALIREALKK